MEIYSGGGEVRRVTSIELLSLPNKTLGEHNREEYLRKQEEMLRSRAHLVEIDFLRGGRHTMAVPREADRQQRGAFGYDVSVHRLDHPGEYLVYPILLNASLPAIKIPLLDNELTDTIELQRVFNRTYKTWTYRRLIDYQETT